MVSICFILTDLFRAARRFEGFRIPKQTRKGHLKKEILFGLYYSFLRFKHDLSKMIVYRDLLSDDEMLSDAFKLLPVLDDEKNPV